MVKFEKKKEVENIKDVKKAPAQEPVKKELKAGDEAFKQSEHTVIIKGN